MASIVVFLLLFLALLGPRLALEIAPSHLCLSSRDCDDGTSCTLDFCEARGRSCVHASVGKEEECIAFGKQIWLKDILNSRGLKAPLSRASRLDIIQSLIDVLNYVHPHRLLHLTALRYDPIVPLIALKTEISKNLTAPPTSTPLQFHYNIMRILGRLGDLHTAYLAPLPLRTMVAFLPFTLLEFYDAKPGPAGNVEGRTRTRKFMVADVANGAKLPPGFKTGVEIVLWDGEGIDDVVRDAGMESAGANDAARVQRGMQYLTFRYLESQPLPKTPSVNITYTANGNVTDTTTVVIPWFFAYTVDPVLNSDLRDVAMYSTGSSSPTKKIQTGAGEREARVLREVRSLAEKGLKISNSKTVVRKLKSFPMAHPTGEEDRITQQSPGRIIVSRRFNTTFTGEVINTSMGLVGVIRIISFVHDDIRGYLRTFAKLVAKMPSTGLIIDVRGNVGGYVALSQVLLQFLTHKEIEPSTFAFRATPITEKLGETPIQAGSGIDAMTFLQYRESLKAAREIGDPYSGSLPEVSREVLNMYKGKRYNGKLIVIVDGSTYSAADLFAASVQDSGAGIVIGTGESSGGGGSSVVSYNGILVPGWPLYFRRLPGGVDLQLSFRRVYRAGKSSGIPLERFGVTPDVRHFPTRRDRLSKDDDLFEFAAMQFEYMEDNSLMDIMRQAKMEEDLKNTHPESDGYLSLLTRNMFRELWEEIRFRLSGKLN